MRDALIMILVAFAVGYGMARACDGPIDPGEAYDYDHGGSISRYTGCMPAKHKFQEPKKLGRRLRDVEALRLRMAGASYQAIADQLGMKVRQTAFDAVQRELNRLTTEVSEKARRIELERLDRLQLALWPAATGGDVEAARAVLQIMDRRARLLGLDKPQRVDIYHQLIDAAREAGLSEAEALEEFQRMEHAGLISLN